MAGNSWRSETIDQNEVMIELILGSLPNTFSRAARPAVLSMNMVTKGGTRSWTAWIDITAARTSSMYVKARRAVKAFKN